MNEIKANTLVDVHTNDLVIRGIIVGKSTTGITESYIIKCIDNQLPNDVYNYDTFTYQLNCIEIVEDIDKIKLEEII